MPTKERGLLNFDREKSFLVNWFFISSEEIIFHLDSTNNWKCQTFDTDDRQVCIIYSLQEKLIFLFIELKDFFEFSL